MKVLRKPLFSLQVPLGLAALALLLAAAPTAALASTDGVGLVPLLSLKTAWATGDAEQAACLIHRQGPDRRWAAGTGAPPPSRSVFPCQPRPYEMLAQSDEAQKEKQLQEQRRREEQQRRLELQRQRGLKSMAPRKMEEKPAESRPMPEDPARAGTHKYGGKEIRKEEKKPE